MCLIAKGLGVIGATPSGGSTKVAMKVRLLDFFAWKETKTKRVLLCLHQVEAYMET